MPFKPRIRHPLQPAWALVALVCGLSGCAHYAQLPDTPARHVSYIDLNDPAPPGEHYYLLVFGSQTTPKIPRFTHTWVTFVRVPCPGGPVEQHTISWMPAKLFINTFQPLVEQGVNLTMTQSIEMARTYGERVSLWGPYEIPPGLYRKLLIQKEFIESGAIGYQCIDTMGEAALYGDGSNCIHAISDADAMFTRQAYPLSFFGEAASLNILRQLVMRKAITDVETTHDWLIPQLGLDQHPIVRREYTPPWFPDRFRMRIMGVEDGERTSLYPPRDSKDPGSGREPKS
jgi:hypothetical protein